MNPNRIRALNVSVKDKGWRRLLEQREQLPGGLGRVGDVSTEASDQSEEFLCGQGCWIILRLEV